MFDLFNRPPIFPHSFDEQLLFRLVCVCILSAVVSGASHSSVGKDGRLDAINGAKGQIMETSTCGGFSFWIFPNWPAEVRVTDPNLQPQKQKYPKAFGTKQHSFHRDDDSVSRSQLFSALV